MPKKGLSFTATFAIEKSSYIFRRIPVKQLHGDRDPQPDGIDRAFIDAATAVGAEFRIGNPGNRIVLRTEEDVFSTIRRTNATCRAFFRIYDWWHKPLLSFIPA